MDGAWRYGGEADGHHYGHGQGLQPSGAQGEGQDEDEQMQLGIMIIKSAFVNKMQHLEQETIKLKGQAEEQRAHVDSLQNRNTSMQAGLIEIHQRTKKLKEEKQELENTKNSLKKQISRIEKLRDAVLCSIKDDEAQEAEMGGPTNLRALMSDEFLRGATPLTAESLGLGTTSGSAVSRASTYPPQQPYTQSSQAPPMYGAMAPPHASPAAQPYPSEPGYGPMDSSSQAPVATGATSPPASIDGKQFFRQARAQLSYEAFNLFLASIKRLNNQQQSREDTLAEARRIFGTELQGLYADFEALLNSHAM